MQSHAKVVVIGGGVVGCSILFHLAKFGLKDCVLLERKEPVSNTHLRAHETLSYVVWRHMLE